MNCPSEKLSKNCIVCGNIFYKQTNLSMKNWIERSIYCSRSCINKGRPSHRKGAKFTPEQLEKCRVAHLGQVAWNKGKPYTQIMSDKHYLWKPEGATMTAHHQWVYRRLGKANHCEQCGLNDPKRWFHWSNISGEYKRDITDYRQLCVPCHKRYDLDKIALHKK